MSLASVLLYCSHPSKPLMLSCWWLTELLPSWWSPWWGACLGCRAPGPEAWAWGRPRPQRHPLCSPCPGRSSYRMGLKCNAAVIRHIEAPCHVCVCRCGTMLITYRHREESWTFRWAPLCCDQLWLKGQSLSWWAIWRCQKAPWFRCGTGPWRWWWKWTCWRWSSACP